MYCLIRKKIFCKKKWFWKGVVRQDNLKKLTDSPESLWDNTSSTKLGINDRVPLEKANEYKNSLYFIKADDVVFHGIQNPYDLNHLKKKTEFTYNRIKYKLSLTDPYENQITTNNSFELQQNYEAYLTISLGELMQQQAARRH